MKFAQVEGVLALSMLVKTFRFEIAEVDKNKVYETETALTLAPKHKIAIVLKRRKWETTTKQIHTHQINEFKENSLRIKFMG